MIRNYFSLPLIYWIILSLMLGYFIYDTLQIYQQNCFSTKDYPIIDLKQYKVFDLYFSRIICLKEKI